MNSVGKDTVAAHRFLQGIYRQVKAIIRSLDNMMSKQGWYPTAPKCVSYDIGPKVYHNWLASYFLRFYSMNDSKRDSIVGVEIYLDPPEGFEEPVCLVFAAMPKGDWNHKGLWDAWQNTDSVFRRLQPQFSPTECMMPQSLDHCDFKGCMRSASEFHSFVIPLCSLSNEEDLANRVVQPTLDTVKRLPTKANTKPRKNPLFERD